MVGKQPLDQIKPNQLYSYEQGHGVEKKLEVVGPSI